MKAVDFKSRFASLVALSYLVPLLFYSFFLFELLPSVIGFWSLAFGWFLLAAGTLLTFIAALFYEKEQPAAIEEDSDFFEENLALKTQLQEMKRKTKEGDPSLDSDLKKKIADLTVEIENTRSQGLLLLQDKEKLISDLQNTLARQKRSNDEKDIILSKFQTKIAELTYEIKTLVQCTTENDQSLFKPLVQESSILLRRCIDIAQQHTGAWSFNPRMSRSSDLSIDSYALDQRRLYQALSREKGGLIFLYSPKDEKILYVNQTAKTLLNVAPETFSQEFSKLIENSRQTFEESVKLLPTNHQAQITLNFKSHPPFPCHLGLIPTGLFKNHVIGVISL